MAEVLKSDIFFFVATVAVVLVTTGFIIALIYLIRILRNTEILSRSIRQQGEEVVEDIGALHKWLKERGTNFIKIFKPRNHEKRNKQ